nr:glycosyltransferase [Thiocapsa sp. UBA6158]
MNTISLLPSIQDSAVGSFGSGPVLVLSAEPGDAVFGCGGACRLHAEAGNEVHVLVITDGRRSAVEPPMSRASSRRLESECHEAAGMLGCLEPIFWHESPSDIQYGEHLVLRLMRLVEDTGSTLLYAPSPLDRDQIRATLGLVAREAIRRIPATCGLIFYDPPASTEPNHLIDITSVFHVKQAAMACLGSLPTVRTPSEHTSDLSNAHARRHPRAIEAAEGMTIVKAKELFRPIAGMLERMKNWTEQPPVGPLVSIVIRSMNRPELSEALDSIAAQTYRHIEVILVDVEGRGRLQSEPRCGRFPLHIASTGGHLGRGAAANVGMMAATGCYIAFLDDDDWFLPDHVASLVGVLEENNSSRVAYAGVACRRQTQSEDWETVHVFNEPFDPTRLLTQNYLPMHAVLFARELVAESLRFDETLDVYEDWDFWLQLNALSDFVHLDRITAIYRISTSGGFGVRAEDPKVAEGLSALFAKWRLRWSSSQIIAITHRANQHLADADQIADLRRQLVEQDRVFREHLAEQDRGLRGHLAERDHAIRNLQSDLNARGKTIEQLQAELAAFNDERLQRLESTKHQRLVNARLETRLAAIQGQHKSCLAIKAKFESRIIGINKNPLWPVSNRVLAIGRRHPEAAQDLIRLAKRVWRAVRFKGRAARVQQARIKRIRNSGLFDEAWYTHSYPEILIDGYDPWQHWLSVGYREGLNPHPLFDYSWYSGQCPEVKTSETDPILHYLDHGAAAGLDPHPLFNSDWYLEHNPDVAASGINPFVHFLTQGHREGRDPHPRFRTSWYLEQNSDLIASGLNPLIHFVLHGRAEGRRPCPADPTLDDVRLGLDSMKGDTVYGSEILPLHGWMIGRGGITEASVLIDGQEWMAIKRTQDRADVQAAHPDLADTLKSGFNITLDISGLKPGDHVVEIAFQSVSGASLNRRINLVVEDRGMRWHFAYFRQQPSPSDARAMARRFSDRESPARVTALISCRLGFPEQLLGDLASQVVPPARVILLPGQQGSGNAEALAWMVPAWSELNSAAPFSISVFSPDTAVADLRNSADHILMLDAGERLSQTAIYYLVRESLGDAPDLVYCDHDLIDAGYLHIEPNLKPAWSPTLLLQRDYIAGCLLIPAARLDEQAVRLYNDPAWRYRQALTATRAPAEVRHVPRVLWSKPANEGTEAPQAGAMAASWILDLDPEARVIEDPETKHRRIRWSLPGPAPKVSIVIPTTGNPKYLVPCIESITGRTTYPDYELIILDNGRGAFPEGIQWLRERGLKIIECNEPFNWARLNNRGAREARGDYLLFLNDDIEVTDPEWLGWLVSHAGRPGVGCVGALMYYPSGEIQHDGVFLVDHGGGVRHWFHRLPPATSLYQRLDRVTREVTAVTGACILVSTSAFGTLGGFDEAFAITHNDVDFCLRAGALGLRNLVVADTSLIHHESVHRGDKPSPDDDKRMWSIWGDSLKHGDRYHHRQFVKTSGDCGIAYDLDDKQANQNHTADGPADGINCIAYVTAEMGLGEAARGILASLDSAGLCVDAIDYRRGNPSRCGDRRYAHRLTGKGRYPTSLYIVNADWLPTVKDDVASQLPNERYAIGYWAWELSEFPRRWTPAFDLVDEIWVASEHVRGGIQRLTEKPVRVVPNPVSVDAHDLPGREFFDLPKDRFIYLTLFDVHSIVARKNPQGAIDAFKSAFDPLDRYVHLVVKVNNADEEARETLLKSIADRPNITIVDRVLTRRETNGLFQSCDVLVSLHRAEGFGLPPAEAMWLGKPVIATNYSGNTDFMTDANSLLIPYRLVKIGVNQGPYDKDAVWAEPDLKAAAAAMRRISADRKLYETIGRAAWMSARAQLAPAVVGRRIAEYLTSSPRQQARDQRSEAAS